MITTETLLDNLPCQVLQGVGPKLAKQLAKRSIETVQDILFHLPCRYQDRTHITPLHDLLVGDHAVVQGCIQNCHVTWGKKPMLLCDIADGSGHLTLKFFHFTQEQQCYLSKGTLIRCFGEVRYDIHGIAMVHPEYQIAHTELDLQVDAYLTPIYPSTEGLTQRMLRHLTDQALLYVGKGALLKEYLPPDILLQFNLCSLTDALQYVHRPPPDAPQQLLLEGLHPMQKRLAFEELVAHNLTMRRVRKTIQAHEAIGLIGESQLEQQFIAALPFELTQAQVRVFAEIKADLNKSVPMLRLVQGDVGSGKTVIAMLAMLQTVGSGYQAALMAPTEILAEQHFKTITQSMAAFNIETAWLTGKLKGKKRQATLAKLASGDAKIIVGTHALFQDDVHYRNLALVIIDEQHRFGVHQRMALRDKALIQHYYPHQLIMTATPIPRTLAMTAYADLETSTIDELPPGRTPISTLAISDQRRAEIIQRVRVVCQEGSQAYWVCTLIEESDMLECQAAEATKMDLEASLPELTVGLIHGRMPAQQKDEIMAAFKAGIIHLLVATTVIEVGVDIPNASLIIIENPERLGLAQLHQLRGRVGRGAKVSYCVLLYKSPLSVHAKERLAILRESTDGFEIARKDLELRGPGEVLGTKQTGIIQFKIAELTRDHLLLPAVQQAAAAIMRYYPQSEDLLIKRWMGNKEQYSQI